MKMHWHQKVPYFLALAIGLTLAVSAESSESPCNPTSKEVYNVTTGASNFYNVLSVTDLKATGNCVWNISQLLSADGSYLDLTSLVLDPKDGLNITGIIINTNKSNTTRTLFTSSGTPVRGLISLGGYNTVLVQLSLVANSTVDRAFYSVYYWSSPVQLQQNEGEITFPLNTDKSPITGGKLEIVPGIQFDGHVVLFNVTQLPANATTSKVTIDGTAVTAATSPKVFLQSKSSVTVTFDMQQVEPITIRWWLVSAQCSELAALKAGEKARPIRVPDSAARNDRHQSAVRCGMAYSTDAGNKLVVHVPPSPTGLPGPGDSVNFIDGLGNVVLGLNNPAVMYFSTGVDTLIETPSALVIYESPYVSSAAAPSTTYQPPEIKAIPSAQASEIILTKDTPVEVKFSATEETVHLVISMDQSKHVQIVFPSSVTGLKPGDLEIKLFASESSVGAVPIATLGQYARLPVSVVSSGPMLRATFKGKQPSTPFTVTYRLVDANSTCGHLSSLMANFEVKGSDLASGGGAPCTWYIPASSAASSVVLSPITIKLPAETTLTLTDFTDLSAKPFSVAGPFSGGYFPDLVLAAKSGAAYELSVASTAKSAATIDGLHVLIAAKTDKFIARNSSFSVAEKVASVSSINYPGAYPVGAPELTETWYFRGNASEWALVSFEDIHLAKSHTLFLTADSPPILFSGDQNMTAVPDYLVKRPFFISQEVNSPLNLTSESKRGFKANIRYPGVAQDLTIDKETQMIFNSTSASAANPLAIWHVFSGKAGQPLGDTILHVNVTLAEGLAKSKAQLSIYDSISMRPGNAHWPNGSFSGTEGHFLGSIRSLWIVYDYSASEVGKVNLTASFVITPEKCTNLNYTLKKCATVDRCITEPMVCNGLNECGDWSDEMYCKGNAPPTPPAPPAPASGGGVNTLVVIFLLMPMSAVLGIVGYIYLPQFLMRIRRGRYSEFRDLSEVS